MSEPKSVFERLLARGADQPVFVTVAIATLVMLLLWSFADWYLRVTGVLEPIAFYDSSVYFGAVDRWRAGEPIYLRNESGGFFGSFLYPPLILLVFDLFHGYGKLSRWGWELFSLALLWGSLQLAIFAFGSSQSS